MKRHCLWIAVGLITAFLISIGATKINWSAGSARTEDENVAETFYFKNRDKILELRKQLSLHPDLMFIMDSGEATVTSIENNQLFEQIVLILKELKLKSANGPASGYGIRINLNGVGNFAGRHYIGYWFGVPPRQDVYTSLSEADKHKEKGKAVFKQIENDAYVRIDYN